MAVTELRGSTPVDEACRQQSARVTRTAAAVQRRAARTARLQSQVPMLEHVQMEVHQVCANCLSRIPAHHRHMSTSVMEDLLAAVMGTH